MALSADNGDEETVTIKLLGALQAIFKPGVEFIPTAELIEILNKDKEAPWADWKNGMTPERLGRTLRAFKVKSEQLQKDGERHRGYFRQALHPVLDRYLSSPSPPAPETCAPVHSSANQVSEPLQPRTGSINQPVQGQIQQTDPCTADQVSEPIGAQVHECTGLKGVIEKGSLNGHRLVQSAVQIFKGEIVGPDEPEPDLSCEAEPKMPASPAPQSKPNPRPALENLLVQILAPHDYDGGLSYGQFRRQAQLPDEVFDQTLKSLCRRGGPVYKSTLNNRYQFSPRFAEILARQKASENGSTQPSDLP